MINHQFLKGKRAYFKWKPAETPFGEGGGKKGFKLPGPSCIFIVVKTRPTWAVSKN